MSLGLIGIILSLGLLMYLAYRGINVLILAPLLALLATLMAGGPMLATYTQVFMPALGKYAMTYFPLFLLGAIFGKVMDVSGSAKAIADFIVDKIGAQRAILAIVLACGILTYGGVSLFVVAFAVFPIAAALFKESGIPKRLIPATIALGSFTFTMTALPGTPAIQNAIPSPYFGTNAFAAPGLGLIAGLIMFGGGVAYLNRRSSTLVAAGEVYEPPVMKGGGFFGRGKKDKDLEAKDREATDEAPVAATIESSAADEHIMERPTVPWALAFLPIVVVIALNYALVNWIFPSMDFDYLKQDAYGSVGIDDVAGIWGIIVALVASIAIVLAANWTRIGDVKGAVNEGTMGSLLPIFNTASEVGYGAVIASLAAFTTIKDAVLGVSGNPLVSLALSVNVLAGITGSASGGMSIALEALGTQFKEMAMSQGISLELVHRVTAISSGGFDALPHNGAVITLLAICGLSHRQSYKDIAVVAILVPVLSLVAIIVLGSIFGSF
ncbi:GntP family permease [Janibacter limosus]|jgi:H+/gluconate symporter-like permease|uniref:GntP family permease n=1 Tax=Janibacter limosus TaxID=53458 RepID=A0A4P6MX19_9MICO|nr:GntP family permease [Janibacter limosus]QBF46140.1 GntP family permease [Janibacter limosus]